ncbi:NAD(P)/FAD-dependent oxidoreductase [Campylobacter troglodytis]|uniref:NAD(P)/FAD-dependent oxidoreductase n=1 Tax=Campylobacter troglodytis TaxID=654363 RepID=UPI001FEC7C54|nr:FAD-binding oxidoreductase [Campylobacter troglodytis]
MDFVIVGAGIAGVSAAYFLAHKYKNAKIALIEALKIGQGTSSRNAGFIIDLPHNLDGNEPNVEYDRKIYELNCYAIDYLSKLVDKHNIDCSWQKAGKYMCAHEDSNIAGLDAFEAHLRPCGFAFERLVGDELERRLGTSYYKEAIFTPDNILMNPSALIRGLVKNLPENVMVFEKSPVLEFKKKLLKTANASIKYETCILTLDPFLEVFGLAKNKLAPIFTYASMTEELSNDEFTRHFSNIRPYGLTSAHPAGTTVRFTPDRRIFVRNLLDFRPNLTCSDHDLKRAYNSTRASFEARFPKLKHKKFDYTWGGVLCMSLNHQSLFGEVAENVYAISASNGVGMAKGVYLARYLVDLIAKESSSTLDFILKTAKPSYIPPDPLRSIGANLRLWWEQKRAAGDL